MRAISRLSEFISQGTSISSVRYLTSSANNRLNFLAKTDDTAEFPSFKEAIIKLMFHMCVQTIRS